MMRIENCPYGFKLNEIIRISPNLFLSDDLRLSQAVLDKIEMLAPDMNNRDISGLLNCLSKQRVQSNINTNPNPNPNPNPKDNINGIDIGNRRNVHRDAMLILAEASRSKINKFNARHISMVVNSLAKRNYVNTELFDAAAVKAIQIIDDYADSETIDTSNFSSQGLTNTVNAFAKMRHVQPELFENVAIAAIDIIDTFNAQELAITANAFAKMNYHHPQLFTNIAHTALPIIHTFKAQELSNILNAFAKMHHTHPQLFHEGAKAAIHIIHTFNAQNMANTLNAFAKVEQPSPQLFQTIGDNAIPIIHAFNAQELAITVNAFAKLNYPHPQLFEHVAKAVIPIITTFHSQGLSITVNAYAKMDYHHTKLFHHVADAAIPILHTFNAQALANTVNAFAKLDQPHPTLFQEVASTAISIIETFTPQELTNTVSAFARVKTDTDTTQHLFSAIACLLIGDTRLSSWSEHLLVELGYAFLKVRHNDPLLLDAIGHALTDRADPTVRLDAREIGHLAACFSHRRVPSSERVLRKICIVFRGMEQETVGLQSVADVAGVIWMVQRLHVGDSVGMLGLVVGLAIDRAGEARPEDLRDILLGVDRAFVPVGMREELLLAYRPCFYRCAQELSVVNRSKIRKIYAQAEISLEAIQYTEIIDTWP